MGTWILPSTRPVPLARVGGWARPTRQGGDRPSQGPAAPGPLPCPGPGCGPGPTEDTRGVILVSSGVRRLWPAQPPVRRMAVLAGRGTLSTPSPELSSSPPPLTTLPAGLLLRVGRPGRPRDSAAVPGLSVPTSPSKAFKKGLETWASACLPQTVHTSCPAGRPQGAPQTGCDEVRFRPRLFSRGLTLMAP